MIVYFPLVLISTSFSLIKYGFNKICAMLELIDSSPQTSLFEVLKPENLKAHKLRNKIRLNDYN